MHVYILEGKFQANVRVKGLDFENSCEGNPCSFPHEARDSAAAQMLTNLRSMAKSAIWLIPFSYKIETGVFIWLICE